MGGMNLGVFKMIYEYIDIPAIERHAEVAR